ncbi:hypothetical protein CTA1_6651 [Colletotrichum tanaceti]|uniref:Uncharacterized protein n=1 Tax=Colletotrichum tanaceti TaxID=1306861 RepID=A0A4U6XN91_9PEZI|nr:hypothetical protein CTA1_6651 [Colletotrichum tanaceti]
MRGLPPGDVDSRAGHARGAALEDGLHASERELVQLAQVDGVGVDDGHERRPRLLGDLAKEAGQLVLDALAAPGGLVERRERVLGPRPELVHDLRAVLADGVQPLVEQMPVVLAQLDIILDGRHGLGVVLGLAAALLRLARGDELVDERLGVPEVVRQVDLVVDGADDGVEAGDGLAHGLREQVGALLAEDADDLLPVPHAEERRVVFQAHCVFALAHVRQQDRVGRLEDDGDDGPVLALALGPGCFAVAVGRLGVRADGVEGSLARPVLGFGYLVHSVGGILCDAEPVRHGADAELGQEDLHHAGNHGRGVADLEGLADHLIGHHLVDLLHELDEVLSLGGDDEDLVGKTRQAERRAGVSSGGGRFSSIECSDLLEDDVLGGGARHGRTRLKVVRPGQVVEQVVAEVAVDEVVHGVVPGPGQVGGAPEVVVRGAHGRVAVGGAADHAAGEGLDDGGGGGGQGLSSTQGALVVALRQVGPGQVAQDALDLNVPELGRQRGDARQLQDEPGEEGLQQGRRGLGGVGDSSIAGVGTGGGLGLGKRVTIVGDGLWLLELFYLVVCLEVGEDVEERLGLFSIECWCLWASHGG